MEIIDLGMLRKRAGLTQAQLAEALNLSQSQISRYESNPEEASVGLARAWTQLCGDVQRSNGVELPVNKRSMINEALASLYGWFQYAPSIPATSELPDLDQLLQSIKTISRKPRIAIAGKYDAGKSTLLNYLFGGKNLPTSYQPTTSIVCHIRHIADKPSWQVEPAVIFSAGYNIAEPDNEENFKEHKLFVGGYEIIRSYGQHSERIDSASKPAVAIKNAAVAVIYLDAPILAAADFLDLPGYSNNEKDSQKAELVNNIFDALIYMSPVNGFLDGQDTNYLPVLIDKLPPVVIDSRPVPLANLFILCTQIHAITDSSENSRKQQLTTLLDGATQRVKPVLAGALKTAGQRSEVKITSKTLRQRMFGFSVDAHVAEISDSFIKEITNFVGDVFPRFTMGCLSKAVRGGKAQELAKLSKVIGSLEKSLTDRKKAEQEVKEMLAKKDVSKAQFNYERKRLDLVIDESLDTTRNIVSDIYCKYVNATYIEKLIRDTYKDKKEAEKYIPGQLLDTLKREINEQVAVVSEKFNDELTGVLEQLGSLKRGSETLTPFDAKGAFLSALTGIGAAGALAGWAAVVAGGSNLGGYILAAKIVGWLSSMGISVGGPAVVMSTIAALGGPVTVALGIGALLAAGLFALFGSDWETRMAKKLVDQFQKQKVQSKFLESMQQYWIDTKNALHQAMDETLIAYDEYIEKRQEDLKLDEPELRERISNARLVEGFLFSTPNI